MRMNRREKSFVGGFALAGVMTVGGYALTNSITFEDASQVAGAGTQTVQSLTVTNTNYTLNATDKSKFDTVTFTVSPAIRVYNADAQAYVRINTSAAWSLCTAPADMATSVTCTFGTPQNVADVGNPGTGVDLVLAE